MSDCQPVRLMIEQPLAKAPDARKTDSLLYILERLWSTQQRSYAGIRAIKPPDNGLSASRVNPFRETSGTQVQIPGAAPRSEPVGLRL